MTTPSYSTHVSSFGDKIQIIKMDPEPLDLHLLRLVNDKIDLVRLLVATYLKNYSNDSKKSALPIIVFCSDDSYAQMLFGLMKEIARKNDERSVDRIKFINNDNYETGWNENFIHNPNKYAADADILIGASIHKIGDTMDCHFRIAFEFLFLDRMIYRQELDFVSRLTYKHRSDMMPFRYGWYEPSRPESVKTSSAQPIDPSNMDEFDLLMHQIKKLFDSEMKQTTTQHVELHLIEHFYNGIRVEQNYNVDWIIPTDLKEICRYNRISELIERFSKCKSDIDYYLMGAYDY